MSDIPLLKLGKELVIMDMKPGINVIVGAFVRLGKTQNSHKHIGVLGFLSPP